MRETVELLTERHRHSVLHLGAADLEDVREFSALLRERFGEQLMLGEQSLNAENHRELDRGGVDVVRALATVDVVNRMQPGIVAPGKPHDLESTIGDDLVGVHVRRGSSAALDDSNAELLVEGTTDDFLANPVYDVGLLPLDHTDFGVRPRRCLFHARERTDEVRIVGDRASRYREILERACGMDAPVCTLRYLHGSERIRLGSGGSVVRRVNRTRALWGILVTLDVFFQRL